MCRTLTYDLGHPRHYHELVRHVVHLVHPELLQTSIQGTVEAVENLNQLKINILAWLHDNCFICKYLNSIAISRQKIEPDNISKKYCDTFKSFSCLLK